MAVYVKLFYRHMSRLAATEKSRIRASSPGRICLFGEHLDYLQLPVVPAAIDLRLTITGIRRDNASILIHLPDIKAQKLIDLPADLIELTYDEKRDYFKSVYNILSRQGLRISSGWECTVSSAIPISSGTSSSSALSVAWTKFLITASQNREDRFKDPEYIGHLAYLAEVEEFGEPGGMMDQMSSAVGGVMRIDFDSVPRLTSLESDFQTFVLGDSGQPKDTMTILSRTKLAVLDAVERIKKEEANFDIRAAEPSELGRLRGVISQTQFDVLKGACLNRDITETAMRLFKKGSPDHKLFGALLSEHHEILDKLLKVSTPKINMMLAKAMDAGAYGGKINGSGGGGCMFVYAPENTRAIAKAIEKAGGTAYIVKVDRGVEATVDF